MTTTQFTAQGTTNLRPLRPVLPWLLLSLGLHLPLMYWLASSDHPTTAPLLQLEVVLVEGRQNAPLKRQGEIQYPAASAKRAHRSDIASPAPRSTNPTPIMPPTQQSEPETTGEEASALSAISQAEGPPSSTATSEADVQLDDQALKLKIQLALGRNFRYPAMALRRGWQGEVQLSFRLERDGRILNAKVARSSGYVILDRAALASLQQIGAIAAQLPSARQLELPVIYRLQEG